MSQHNIRESLLFDGVDKAYVETFLTILPKSEFRQGEYLWRQGDAGNSMFLLEKGRLEVVLENWTSPEGEVVANIDRGAVIGELCVFGQKKRSASIRAAEDSQVLEVSSQTFRQRILDREIDVLLISFNIAKLLSERLAASNDFIRCLQAIPEKTPVLKSELEHFRQRFISESLFN